MRLLFAIPHYFDPSGGSGRGHGSLADAAERRLEALSACLSALRQLFGRPQALIDIARRTTVPVNQLTADRLDVVVCTTRGRHLLDRLDLEPGTFRHHPTGAAPALLGYECHAVLRDCLGSYDYYAYLEDDLIVRDPWFFLKLAWFSSLAGPDALLQPNRYEVARRGFLPRAYVDGDLADHVVAPHRCDGGPAEVVGETFGVRTVFRRAANPHAGCFFLDEDRLRRWAARPDFLDRATDFVGPLESAATLGVLRAFHIYKPAAENAAFLEVEHTGTAFLDRVRRPDASGTSPG